MATSLLADQIVLDSLLVAHLFDKIGDLLHRLLNLRHDALLAIQCLLLLSSLRCANHLNLRVEPSPEVLLVLGPEGHFILELASQVLVHLPEHAGGRVCGLLESLLRADLFFTKSDELLHGELTRLLDLLQELRLASVEGLLHLRDQLRVLLVLGLAPHFLICQVLAE